MNAYSLGKAGNRQQGWGIGMIEVAQLFVETALDPTLDGAKIFLPGGQGDVISAVIEYLRTHVQCPYEDGCTGLDERCKEVIPKNLWTYIEAVRAVWPNLWKSDQKAGMMLACEVYLEAAEKCGFIIDLDNLKGVTLDDQGRIHGNEGGNDGSSTGQAA